MIRLEKIPPEAGIRRIGFAICYEYYAKIFGRYPENSDQLLQVTTSIIPPKKFDRYVIWWSQLKDSQGDILS